MTGDIRERYAAVARELLAEPTEELTLDRAVALAHDLVDGCDHAGITIRHRKALETAAATDDLVRRGDDLQYELDEGPCVDSLRYEQTTHSPDLANERRWPAWGPRVVEELGVRSMLCFQLFTDAESLGALNLYADGVAAFDDDAFTVGITLAAQIAVAVQAARQVDHQNHGMATRTVIGQAQGVLMERYSLTPARAFDFLRRISQDNNTKLVAVAADVVQRQQHGQLPEASAGTTAEDVA